MKKMSLNDGSPFLLTPLREGRPGGDRKVQHHRQISTHAPAGGATRPVRGRRTRLRNFYSRPCGRGDCDDHLYLAHNIVFLLTPLREGRPVTVSHSFRHSAFLLTPLREGRRSVST